MAVLYVYHFGCRAFIIIMGVIQQIMLQIFFTLIEEGKKKLNYDMYNAHTHRVAVGTLYICVMDNIGPTY